MCSKLLCSKNSLDVHLLIYIHVVIADFLKPSLNFRCNFMSILSCVTSPPVTEMTMLGAFSFQYVIRSRQICPESVSRSSTRIYGFYIKKEMRFLKKYDTGNRKWICSKMKRIFVNFNETRLLYIHE